MRLVKWTTWTNWTTWTKVVGRMTHSRYVNSPARRAHVYLHPNAQNQIVRVGDPGKARKCFALAKR